MQHEATWKSHTVRCDTLVKHRGQAHNLLLGQCTKMLDDQMKLDDDYKQTVNCTDALQLFRLIEKPSNSDMPSLESAKEVISKPHCCKMVR